MEAPTVSAPSPSTASSSAASPGCGAIDLHALRQRLTQYRADNAKLWTPRANPDRALRHLAKSVDSVLSELWACAGFGNATLVAVGGYGRGELSPFSDVDLLILMPNDYQEPEITGPAERLVSAFWDIGLDAGHSIRSIDECMQAASEELSIATALLESRWVAGPKAPVNRLLKQWFDTINVKEFAQGKLLELQQRHGRHQDTPYSLEPNCKESPGGLRDLQVLRWVTTAFGLGHRWKDLATNDLITEPEARELDRCQRLLNTIRGHLHLAAGRREDRLVFDLQNAVAERMDFAPVAGKRASEVLMQRYYRAAKAILQISSMLLANLEPRLFPSSDPNTAQSARIIDDEFQDVYGLLDMRHEQLFTQDPAAILRAFLCFQQHPELHGMTARTLRALWNHRDCIDSEFRRSKENRQLFLSVFQQPAGIVHGLRLMNNLGVLGRMLPVFRKIVGQMQHDLFHVYTVDQHILQVIRNLRRFSMDEHAHEFPLCSQLANEFPGYWRLYIAALFHDIAKGRGGDHSVLGKAEVRRFARDYGLDTETSKLLMFLVEHHLTMSVVAQKQDLADPETIMAFAKVVKTTDRLNALYLLTVADIRGTSPKVWNMWKARLLEELYQRTMKLLTQTQPGQQHEPLRQQDAFEAKTGEAERLLRLHGKEIDAARSFWKTLELQYFLRHDANEIEWHARRIAWRANADDPIVIARLAPDEAGLQVVVYQPDAADLFARICSYFDRQNMSILDAKIHTTSDGYAMDTFVVDPKQFPEHLREMVTIVEAGLGAALRESGPLPQPSQGRVSRLSRYFPIRPTIDLRADSRGQYHVLNVTAADRTGLLYAIARTLAQHAVRVQTARVMTLGERAEDVFLVEGDAVEDPRAQIALEADLLKAIA